MVTKNGKINFMNEITINSQTFIPIPGVNYKNDYVKWSMFPERKDTWEEIFPGATGLTKGIVEKNILRHLVLNDLWFIVYFILGIPTANHPFVVDFARKIEEGPDTNTLDIVARGHFKALALDTPVPTPTGFVQHGNLKPGDKIYSPSGDVISVIGKSEIFHDKDCYKITFDTGATCVASGDHLWMVQIAERKYRGNWKNRVKV